VLSGQHFLSKLPRGRRLVNTFGKKILILVCEGKPWSAWEVADSLCLNPPVYGLSPQAVMTYTAAIAETFYS
jgi:hypothetical protein